MNWRDMTIELGLYLLACVALLLTGIAFVRLIAPEQDTAILVDGGPQVAAIAAAMPKAATEEGVFVLLPPVQGELCDATLYDPERISRT